MKRGRTRADRKRPPTDGPLQHVVVGLDGAPTDVLFDDCPVCMKLRREGTPTWTFDRDTGEAVPIHLEPPPSGMILTLDADANVTPILGPVPREVELPPGCSTNNLIEWLCFEQPLLREAFPDGLRAEVGGRRVRRDRVLKPGETVKLRADAPPTTYPN